MKYYMEEGYFCIVCNSNKSHLHNTIDEATRWIQHSQAVYKRKFNKYQKDKEFNAGSLVFAKLQSDKYKKIEHGGSTGKHDRQYYGWFYDKKQHTGLSYEFRNNEETRMHHIFHITILENPMLIHLEPKYIVYI